MLIYNMKTDVVGERHMIQSKIRNKSKRIGFVVGFCTIFILVVVLVLIFKNSAESAFLPLEDRPESDEMVILANELSEQILNVLHQEFPNREFTIRRIEIEQIGLREREILRFVVHCLTAEVDFVLWQSQVTDDRRSTDNIVFSYVDRLQMTTRSIWSELFYGENQRLERIITNIYGESSVQVYTRESYRDDQQFPDGKTETEHPYYVTFFWASLRRNRDADFIEEVSVVFPDVATLIETVGPENLSLVRVSLSYDVFLEDDFNKEFEITRIRMVLYEFLSEIQEHVTEEITFELFSDSRIDFIRDDGDVVWRFRNPAPPTKFTLSELNEFDFASFFREEY